MYNKKAKTDAEFDDTMLMEHGLTADELSDIVAKVEEGAASSQPSW